MDEIRFRTKQSVGRPRGTRIARQAGMRTVAEPVLPLGNTLLPRVLLVCSYCKRETPHEIHAFLGMDITVCVPCQQRALVYEMDRDQFNPT